MIFFRADSNSKIASGHIMRCITIASFFKKKGQCVKFLIADLNPIKMLENANMDYEVLNTKWDDLSTEVEIVSDILLRNENSLFIIDTYSVTKSYVDILSHYGKICYLGGINVDLGYLSALINYSSDINLDFYAATYSSKTQLLLGPSFAPLREDFYDVPPHYQGHVNRVLITTGNTDPLNFTKLILLELINMPNFDKIEFEVIIGHMSIYGDNLKDNFSNYPNIHLRTNVTSISNFMKISDVAISANGTSVYELAASKVAIISFAMVPEQLKSAIGLHKLGATMYCGELYRDPDSCIKNIVNALATLDNNSRICYSLIEKASSLINGNGCQRIYNSFVKHKLL